MCRKRLANRTWMIQHNYTLEDSGVDRARDRECASMNIAVSTTYHAYRNVRGSEINRDCRALLATMWRRV